MEYMDKTTQTLNIIYYKFNFFIKKQNQKILELSRLF